MWGKNERMAGNSRPSAPRHPLNRSQFTDVDAEGEHTNSGKLTQPSLVQEEISG